MRTLATGISNLALALALAGAPLTAAASPPSSTPDEGFADAVARSSTPREPAAKISQDALSHAVAANNAFALDLYANLRAAPGLGSANLVASPVSAWFALTMAYAGAKGTTATEMTKALHIGADDSIFDGQNALGQALDQRAPAALAAAARNAQAEKVPAPSADDYQLQLVNSVWGERSYPWAQPFLDVLAKDYGTGVRLADFKNAPDPARRAINAWVSEQTANEINDLLPQDVVDGSTRMVLVNAVHVKMPWLEPFDPERTKPATFTKSDGTKLTASFMHRGATARYADDGKAQLLALPLQGSELNVVIALPHADLATYEQGLLAGSLAIPGTATSISLALPKVSFTSPTFSLRNALVAMGMVQAFDQGADFSGACPNPPDGGRIGVSDVFQKAMVAIQEQGIEAAAAAAVVTRATGVPSPSQPVAMVVDRPFVIAIEDATTGAILFVGHIEDPTQSG